MREGLHCLPCQHAHPALNQTVAKEAFFVFVTHTLICGGHIHHWFPSYRANLMACSNSVCRRLATQQKAD